MACEFDDLNSDYLVREEAVVTDYPFTMACAFYCDDITVAPVLMAVLDRDSDTRSCLLQLINDGGNYEVWARTANGTWCQAQTTTTFILSTWNHACGVFAAANDRRVFLNGGGKGTDSTSRTTSGYDRTCIGALMRASSGNYMSGYIAEAAIWNAALTDEEVAVLAEFVSPLSVRPQNLIAYWPLVRDIGGSPKKWQELVAGRQLQNGNEPTAANTHCRIICPRAATMLRLQAQLGITPLLLRRVEKY
jgi:hypothetical protein